MDFIKQFLSEYGMMILNAIITAFAGYIGLLAKRVYEKFINSKEKQEVAETVVQAIEQMYSDLGGEEKLNHALSAGTEMLMEKGISITELEMRMLIESTVSKFNDSFNKESKHE